MGVNIMWFVHQIKRTNGNVEKGIVVKNSFEEAKQAYHAYLGAYAYGHEANTDYVQSMITDEDGSVFFPETWKANVQ